MLANVLDAYNLDQVALIDAGTGIGKSLAYLLPAILWSAQNRERTLISTNTISLQEQLLFKDIPLAAKVLGLPIKAVLIKGMSNYVCLRRLQEAVEERDLLDSIQHWAEHTKEGSRSSLPMAVSSSVWEKICAESDSCTRRRCPFFQQCHFFKARQEAEEADLLIVNHALFFADLAYRGKNTEETKEEAGFLPGYSKVILDEAHHLEKVATDFFADRVSYLSLVKHLARLGGEKQGRLSLLTQKIVLHFTERMPSDLSHIHFSLSIDLPATRQQLLHRLTGTFEELFSFLYAQHPEESDAVHKEQKLRLLPYHYNDPRWKAFAEQVAHLLPELRRYLESIDLLLKALAEVDQPKLLEQTEGLRSEIRLLTQRLRGIAGDFEQMMNPPKEKSFVVWIEGSTELPLRDLRLIHARLDVSEKMAEALFSSFSTTVLCSATLATNHQFHFIRKNLGLTPELLPKKIVTEGIYPSPFDYQKQVLLVVPRDLPDPNDPSFVDAVSEKIWLSLLASRGGAFVLFTSYSMMIKVHQKLSARCAEQKWKLLLQGDFSRSLLLEKFKQERSAVLFGTDSFWEGVDVVGDSLRCVVIVKLPFRVPSEPIVAAKTDWIKELGRQPFKDYSLPDAIIKFKQGFGRLIRSKQDHGCVVCLDPRLITKNYGSQFLKSLPICSFIEVGNDAEMKQAMEGHYFRKQGR